MRKEIDQCLDVSHEFPGLENSMAKLGFSTRERAKFGNFNGTASRQPIPKFIKNGKDNASMGKKVKDLPLATDNAVPSSKHTKKAKTEKRQFQTGTISTPLKRQKR